MCYRGNQETGNRGCHLLLLRLLLLMERGLHRGFQRCLLLLIPYSCLEPMDGRNLLLLLLLLLLRIYCCCLQNQSEQEHNSVTKKKKTQSLTGQRQMWGEEGDAGNDGGMGGGGGRRRASEAADDFTVSAVSPTPFFSSRRDYQTLRVPERGLLLPPPPPAAAAAPAPAPAASAGHVKKAEMLKKYTIIIRSTSAEGRRKATRGMA